MELIVLMPIDSRHIPTHLHLNGRIRGIEMEGPVGKLVIRVSCEYVEL